MRISLCICLSLFTATSALWAGRPVDESRPAAPDAKVEIENMSGSVVVTGWSEDRVRVSGTLGDDTEGLQIQGDRQKISIEVDTPEWHSRRVLGDRDYDSDLEIWVPVGSHISVETVSAGIEVRGVEGSMDLESVSGGIVVEGGSQEVELATVSGSITFSGSRTPISVESVSGAVHLSGVADRVEVSTVSGSIEVESDTLAECEVESVSGRIFLEGDLAPRGRLKIDGHSSNITLALPASVSASFEIETFSGRIDNEFGPEAETLSRYAPGKRLEFSTGGGDARVSIDTFSGSVHLKRR